MQVLLQKTMCYAVYFPGLNCSLNKLDIHSTVGSLCWAYSWGSSYRSCFHRVTL